MAGENASNNPHEVAGSAGPESGLPPTNDLDSVRRRKLLKGGAAALIMTVSSKSALGGPCTVSGALSGNLSVDHGAEFCGGRSPGYWRRNLSDGKTRFGDVFGALWHGSAGPWNPKVTLKEVLAMTGNQDRYQFGAHAVAAYLNALLLPSYPMSTHDVIKVVRAVLSPAGVYIDPVTGKSLDVINARDFFSDTFDAG